MAAAIIIDVFAPRSIEKIDVQPTVAIVIEPHRAGPCTFHDVAQLEEPVLINVAREGDQITQMYGKRKDVPVGDMLMRDAGDVACTILRGQDNRSPISKTTTHVLYVSYVPAGITETEVRAQLEMMEKHVRLFAPGCRVEQNELICAKP